MNQQHLFYRVGPHTFAVSGHLPADLSSLLPSYRPFLLEGGLADSACDFSLLLAASACEPSEGGDGRIRSSRPEQVDAGGSVLADFEWEDARCLIRQEAGGGYLISLQPHGLTGSYILHSSPDFSRNRLCLAGTDDCFWPFVLNNFLMMLYTFATAPKSTLMMHASVIEHGGKAYLFLGRSGTGKSTHSRLWLEHIPGSRLLNDDNPVVHVGSGGTVTVYGSPWSGKTPCYLNESCPAGAFIRLEQAPANEITRLPAVHAFAAVLPSCSCLKQQEAVYRGVLSAVTKLATVVPVYHLKCLPDAEAARLCCRAVVGSDGGQE